MTTAILVGIVMAVTALLVVAVALWVVPPRVARDIDFLEAMLEETIKQLQTEHHDGVRDIGLSSEQTDEHD